MRERLRRICSLIEFTPSFIDIGCDHGLVVKYVLDNNLSSRVVACDISLDSLSKAKRLIGEDSRAEFVCGDGALINHGCDTVLISGLGGIEMLSIIESCFPKEYILSPQSHAYEVRKSLLCRDYDIVYDEVLFDGKFYDVIKAVRGGGLTRLEKTDEVRLEYGIYADRYNPALKEKAEKLLEMISHYPCSSENERKTVALKEVLKWQSR